MELLLKSGDWKETRNWPGKWDDGQERHPWTKAGAHKSMLGHDDPCGGSETRTSQCGWDSFGKTSKEA